MARRRGFRSVALGTALRGAASSSPPPVGTNYFVSPDGDDGNDGLTQLTAWETSAKVMASVFRANDIVQFEGGETFDPIELTTANWSGVSAPSAAYPVTFTSYGAGVATIAAGSGENGFKATNLHGITIDGLTVTGDDTIDTLSRGIWLDYTSGSHSGAVIANCTVSGFASCGIMVTAWTDPAATLANLTIDNCDVSGCTGGDTSSNEGGGSAGIYVAGFYGADVSGLYQFSNVTISNCISHDNPGVAGTVGAGLANWTGSGIFLAQCNGGLIEHCVAEDNGTVSTADGSVAIFTPDDNNVTIRHCVARGQQGSAHDGTGFDLGSGSKNCTVEYCLSEGNAGAGYFLFCYDDPGFIANATNIVCRFNVSINDAAVRQNPVYVNHQGSGTLSADIHNNTVYYGGARTIACALVSNAVTGGTGAIDAFFANNIFYAAGANTSYINVDVASRPFALFYGNDYFGATTTNKIRWGSSNYTTVALWRAAVPAAETVAGNDTSKTSNPLLVNAGGTTAADYQLQSGSPMVNVGLDLNALFGIAAGSTDYFGHPIVTSSLDVGFNEFSTTSFELREDGTSLELRDDGGIELRE